MLVFTKEAIKDLFSHMEVLSKTATSIVRNSLASKPDPTPSSGSKLHVSSIAGRLNAKRAPDLAIAAAAALQIYQSLPTFTRNQVLDQMKDAKEYYNANMAKNHTATISNLVKNKIFNKTGADEYSLTASKREELGQQLAE